MLLLAPVVLADQYHKIEEAMVLSSIPSTVTSPGGGGGVTDLMLVAAVALEAVVLIIYSWRNRFWR